MVRLPVIISHLPLLEDLPVGLHLVVLLEDLSGAHHPLVAVPAHSELEALEHGADVGLLEHLEVRGGAFHGLEQYLVGGLMGGEGADAVGSLDLRNEMLSC